MPRRLLAQELERRVHGRTTLKKHTVICQVARLGSLGSLARLLNRSARDVRGQSETLGLENQLVKCILWSRLRGNGALVSSYESTLADSGS